MINRAIAAASAVALLAVFSFVVGLAYQKGVSHGDAQRTEKALEREREMGRAITSAVRKGGEATAALITLQQQSTAERLAWKERLDAKNNASLVEAPPLCLEPGPAAAGAAVPDLQLSADFRGLYDDAWCAAAGDAVSAASCRAAAAAARPGPVAPRAVLQHTAEQTATCAADRQRLDGLIAILNKPPWKAAPTP